jgi:hypothetical protein
MIDIRPVPEAAESLHAESGASRASARPAPRADERIHDDPRFVQRRMLILP